MDAVWTPTVLLLDAAGKERVRLEGYLPHNDFMAALKSGLGHIAFMQKKYADAEPWYGDVVAQPRALCLIFGSWQDLHKRETWISARVAPEHLVARSNGRMRL